MADSYNLLCYYRNLEALDILCHCTIENEIESNGETMIDRLMNYGKRNGSVKGFSVRNCSETGSTWGLHTDRLQICLFE